MPSEHIIDDEQQELEFHLVHMNEQGENLVVGILFRLTDKLNWICNQQDDSIWDFKTIPNGLTHRCFTGNDPPFSLCRFFDNSSN